MGKYRSKYVSPTVSEGRLDGLEDVRDIGLECRERLVVEFDASRARLLQISNYFPDTRNKEVCLYVRDDLEDVLTMA